MDSFAGWIYTFIASGIALLLASPIFPELVKGGLALVGIVLAAQVALRGFYRQKEYDLVKQRYLEGAVDLVAAHVSSKMATVSFNYALCLQINKSFRDGGIVFQLKELDQQFLEFKEYTFLEIAHYRLKVLTGSDVFWEAFQTAMAYCETTNYFITREVIQVIRAKCTTDAIAKSRPELAEEIANKMRDLHDGSFRFAAIVRELENLAQILETQRLRLKQIRKVSKIREVRKIVDRLIKLFPDSGPNAAEERLAANPVE